MKKHTLVACCLFTLINLSSCKDYLDAKPDKSLATIGSLYDMQSLLDDYLRLNSQSNYAAAIASDDYYVNDVSLAAITQEADKRIYNWQKGYPV